MSSLQTNCFPLFPLSFSFFCWVFVSFSFCCDHVSLFHFAFLFFATRWLHSQFGHWIVAARTFFGIGSSSASQLPVYSASWSLRRGDSSVGSPCSISKQHQTHLFATKRHQLSGSSRIRGRLGSIASRQVTLKTSSTTKVFVVRYFNYFVLYSFPFLLFPFIDFRLQIATKSVAACQRSGNRKQCLRTLAS